MLEQFYDAAALSVVFEAAVDSHQLVECLFTGVTKRGVTKVVSKADRLGEVLVDSQCAGNISRNGGDFHRVCEPSAQVVAAATQENLSLAVEPPKGPGMDDSIAVALVLCAPFGQWLLDVSAS